MSIERLQAIKIAESDTSLTWTYVLGETGEVIWSCQSVGSPVWASDIEGLATQGESFGRYVACIFDDKLAPVYVDGRLVVSVYKMKIENGQIVDLK